MRRLTPLALAVASFVLATGCQRENGTLQSASKTLGASDLKSIEFSATGRWFQFGQAPAPDLAWPPFDVSRYTATIDYDHAGARVQITRKQTVEAGRARPAAVEQKPDQYVSGGLAWNIAPPAGAPADAAPVAQTQPAAVEERSAEIWSTPQGFLKAAAVNRASSKAINGGTEVSFTVGKERYVGTINAHNEVERVQTWIDNPVLGDTLIETRYSDYKKFNGISFPAHIVRTEGGFPVLDLNVATVTPNALVDIKVPDAVNATPVPPITVTVETLAPGVLYLRGGTHHSVVIEQTDHIVVVEAPLNEARSEAVIAKVKETFPNKPIRYLINTHAHFDHSGGLRTYVDAGATIVTEQANRAYYETVWAAPHSIAPDKLAQSKKASVFDTFTDKHVLSDGKRSIEIYRINGSGHNDAFALIYLPTEKILIEADAYTPTAPGAPAPTSINPYSVNLYDNIQRLKLDVDQIAAIHGPGVVKLTDLQAAIAPKS
ncbi:MAG: fold metallo-hydrolase [Hydrocarboniphaga sp.]|uniref:MBL fold metallo-hydrolase n=1 Tax=Hydrocarboniphaga sp. TaxID=2033016 RepID=UPI0026132BDF|nr:MBL fold metallo-hydrolase [Hydrocarboniphaga sp.]MDB5970468.1 fold metallo-hydrolase [Hydrocarboniphaga sp.]